MHILTHYMQTSILAAPTTIKIQNISFTRCSSESPLSTPHPRKPRIWFLSLQKLFSILENHISVVILSVAFGRWFLELTTLISRGIQVTLCVSILHSFFYCWYLILWIYHNLFLQLSVDNGDVFKFGLLWIKLLWTTYVQVCWQYIFPASVFLKNSQYCLNFQSVLSWL